jgi:class 3 adenylate cyclase
MLNILPAPIADRLKKGEQNISGDHTDVSVLFADIVEFTRMSTQVSAAELVRLLNDLFSRFDMRAREIGLEKIKTIGDAYMVVGGLPTALENHAELCAEMAFGMLDDLQAFNDLYGANFRLRIGINSGPVVAGVIGSTKFAYDLWGLTVNAASRMESTAPAGRIQVSEDTAKLLEGKYLLESGGLVECKGLGELSTRLLIGRRANS